MTEMHLMAGLVGLNTVLLGILGFFVRRALEKLENLGFHKEQCLREFATKEETDELFAVSRRHGEEIASLKTCASLWSARHGH